MKPQRWGGAARGRSHTVAHGDLVWTVSNTRTPGADFDTQVEQTLAFLESSLKAAGSSKQQMLSVQVLLTDIARRESFDRRWCEWIGDDPDHWPQRAVYQAALAPGLDIEMIVTAWRE